MAFYGTSPYGEREIDAVRRILAQRNAFAPTPVLGTGPDFAPTPSSALSMPLRAPALKGLPVIEDTSQVRKKPGFFARAIRDPRVWRSVFGALSAPTEGPGTEGFLGGLSAGSRGALAAAQNYDVTGVRMADAERRALSAEQGRGLAETRASTAELNAETAKLRAARGGSGLTPEERAANRVAEINAEAGAYGFFDKKTGKPDARAYLNFKSQSKAQPTQEEQTDQAMADAVGVDPEDIRTLRLGGAYREIQGPSKSFQQNVYSGVAGYTGPKFLENISLPDTTASQARRLDLESIAQAEDPGILAQYARGKDPILAKAAKRRLAKLAQLGIR